MKSTSAKDTYDLVQSLTTAEKSYFKRSLQKRSDGKLVKVFATLSSLNSFDEKTLGTKVGAIYTNHAEAYRQLTATVLRALSQYHASKSAIPELNSLLSQIAVTREKQLFSICDKLIDRGLKISEENELFDYSFMLWLWRSKIPASSSSQEQEWFEGSYSEMKRFVNLLNIRTEQSVLHFNFNQFLNQKHITRASRDAFLNNLLANDLLHSDHLDKTSSFMLKVHGYNVINGVYFYYGDLEKALAGCKKLIDLLGPVDRLSDRMYYNWIAISGNMLEICCRTYNREDYMSIRNALVESVSLREGRPEDLSHSNLPLKEAMHLINEGQFADALQNFQALLENEITTEFATSSQVNLAKAGIGKISFYEGRFSEALSHLTACLAEKNYKRDSERLYEALWLEVLCTYEMGDEALFESRKLAFSRYLKKDPSGFTWETEILSTLNDTFKLTEKERVRHFQLLFESVSPYRFEFSCTLSGFDLLLWVEAKALSLQFNQFITGKYRSAN